MAWREFVFLFKLLSMIECLKDLWYMHEACSPCSWIILCCLRWFPEKSYPVLFLILLKHFLSPDKKKNYPTNAMSLVGKLNMFGEFSPFHFKLVRVSFFLFSKERCNRLLLVYIGPISQRSKGKYKGNKVKRASLCPVQVWKTYIEFIEQSINLAFYYFLSTSCMQTIFKLNLFFDLDSRSIRFTQGDELALVFNQKTRFA